MKGKRIFEIDLLRATAICLMIIFHLSYDLKEFAGLNVNYESPLLYTVGKMSALLFIFVSGISSGLSRNSIKRGIKVLAFGLIITAATYLFEKSDYVRFGILHFLGVSMLLFPLLKRMRIWQLAVSAVLSYIIGIFAANTAVNTFLLLPLGFTYFGFNSMDYYPLFPYISAFIFGIIAYKLYYYKRVSIFEGKFNSGFVNFISKNSLWIYLIHQPIFLVVIYIINAFKK